LPRSFVIPAHTEFAYGLKLFSCAEIVLLIALVFGFFLIPYRGTNPKTKSNASPLQDDFGCLFFGCLFIERKE
jgi:hypothetical protein